jgi:predicted O-methyltransferase YrrM
MRTFGHWTPRYVADRIANIYYQKSHPDAPWLTPEANRFLESYLRSTDVGLEYGSGRSTLWFANHTRHLTSIEGDNVWFASVGRQIRDAQITNVDYRFLPTDFSEDGAHSPYVEVLHTLENGGLDYALIDGAHRDFCVAGVLPKLRAGGLLIIDNVNRYLPSRSRSPASRTLQEGPLGPLWSALHEQLSTWRSFWTSCGISDTALYFKPAHPADPGAS